MIRQIEFDHNILLIFDVNPNPLKHEIISTENDTTQKRIKYFCVFVLYPKTSTLSAIKHIYIYNVHVQIKLISVKTDGHLKYFNWTTKFNTFDVLPFRHFLCSKQSNGIY